MAKKEISWWPQPRQLKCLEACGLDTPFSDNALRTAVADIVGYGGAAGGGKTDTLLQVALVAAVFYPKINIGYFRREFPQLEGPGGAILRSHELISHIAKYNEQKHRWTFPNGALIQFCHCKNPLDVYNYQSQQFDILLIDEVTQFTREMVKYLLTRNRATIDFETFKPFACFGTNPGNVGHGYFKEEFVTIGQPETVCDFINEVGNVEKHIFIPSKLKDNEILVKRDPGYEMRVGNTELNRKVLLEGDWDIFAGQAFGELTRDVHVIDPIEIPRYWKKFGAFDHGFNHPYSFGVFAVDMDGNVYLIARARGRLKRTDEIARHMVDVCESIGGIENLDYIEAGLDCWSRQRNGSPSIAEEFLTLPQKFPGLPKISLRRAKIDRVQGASQVRYFLAWRGILKEKDVLLNGVPKFRMFRNTQEVYDTLSLMIFDPNKPEDVLKVDADELGRGGDDDYDMVRYGLMSRPRPNQPVKEKYPDDSGMKLLQEHMRLKELERSYFNWR